MWTSSANHYRTQDRRCLQGIFDAAALSLAVFIPAIVFFSVLVVVHDENPLPATTHTLFMLHPLCMSLGACLFFATGILAYKIDFGLQSRFQARRFHVFVSIVGGCCLFAGVIFVILSTSRIGELSMPHLLHPHGIVGLLALLAVAFHIATGAMSTRARMLARAAVSSDGRIIANPAQRTHVRSGVFVWLAVIAAVFTGIAHAPSSSLSQHLVLGASSVVRSLLYVLVGALTAVVLARNMASRMEILSSLRSVQQEEDSERAYLVRIVPST